MGKNATTMLCGMWGFFFAMIGCLRIASLDKPDSAAKKASYWKITPVMPSAHIFQRQFWNLSWTKKRDTERPRNTSSMIMLYQLDARLPHTKTITATLNKRWQTRQVGGIIKYNQIKIGKYADQVKPSTLSRSTRKTRLHKQMRDVLIKQGAMA
jgi:hypothetical protein